MYCTSISSAKAAQLMIGMKTFTSTSTLILVVISSQLSTCAYRRGLLDKADGGGDGDAGGVNAGGG